MSIFRLFHETSIGFRNWTRRRIKTCDTALERKLSVFFIFWGPEAPPSMCTHQAHNRHIDEICCYFLTFCASCATCVPHVCASCVHILGGAHHLKIQGQGFPTPCRTSLYDKNSLLYLHLSFEFLKRDLSSMRNSKGNLNNFEQKSSRSTRKSCRTLF